MSGGCPLRVLLRPLLLCAILSRRIVSFSTRRPLFCARPSTSAFDWSSNKHSIATIYPSTSYKLSALSSTPWPLPEVEARAALPSTRRAARDVSMAKLAKITGGAAPAVETSQKQSFSLSALWGVVGVVAMLSNAIRRLLPIALEPFKKTATPTAFTPLHWAQYVGFALIMAYAEGYKGFQLKFSPLVVKRALTLGPRSPLLHKVLAAPYSMGLFHASKKRQIVSWTIALGVIGLVKAVKTLAFPYRSIVDAGVVAGLSWGALSIAGIYAQALRGHVPSIDPALPDVKKA
ncbi:hypothetical protein Naga_100015g35 [Nannochloropsis gaditana]|uniref:Uncharacterized protein n=1 Tax=Nannochloropsis gaditana TaxID=72520 RepID=W7TVP9_9STRA|nr:hypothetical protein Naga_100015g35 [Nannochloropsis gaditana]